MRAGFTLIELLVILIIAAILLTIGISELGRYSVKYAVENEIDTLYGDMLNQRFLSMNRSQSYGVFFATNYYQLFKFNDVNFNQEFDGASEEAEVKTKKLRYPIVSNCVSNGQNAVLFDYLGVARNASWSIAACTIRVLENTGGVNCIVVTPLRIARGVYNGVLCKIK